MTAATTVQYTSGRLDNTVLQLVTRKTKLTSNAMSITYSDGAWLMRMQDEDGPTYYVSLHPEFMALLLTLMEEHVRRGVC